MWATQCFWESRFWQSIDDSCQQAGRARDALFSAVVCVSSFLFFLRIRAIYFSKRLSTALFFAAWLTVLGSCTYTPFAILTTNVKFDDTDRLIPVSMPSSALQESSCEISVMRVSCISCFVSAAVFDTIVFGFATWRILRFCVEDGWKVRLEYFFGRRRLPFFSEAILRGSQLYYTWVILYWLPNTCICRDWWRLSIIFQNFDIHALACYQLYARGTSSTVHWCIARHAHSRHYQLRNLPCIPESQNFWSLESGARWPRFLFWSILRSNGEPVPGYH